MGTISKERLEQIDLEIAGLGEVNAPLESLIARVRSEARNLDEVDNELAALAEGRGLPGTPVRSQQKGATRAAVTAPVPAEVDANPFTDDDTGEIVAADPFADVVEPAAAHEPPAADLDPNPTVALDAASAGDVSGELTSAETEAAGAEETPAISAEDELDLAFPIRPSVVPVTGTPSAVLNAELDAAIPVSPEPELMVDAAAPGEPDGAITPEIAIPPEGTTDVAVSVDSEPESISVSPPSAQPPAVPASAPPPVPQKRPPRDRRHRSPARVHGLPPRVSRPTTRFQALHRPALRSARWTTSTSRKWTTTSSCWTTPTSK